MTFKELRETVELMHSKGIEDERHVCVHIAERSIGALSQVPIKSIADGVDWNRGTVLIFPAVDLVKK